MLGKGASAKQKIEFATTAVKPDTFNEYAKVHLLKLLYPLPKEIKGIKRKMFILLKICW